MSNFDESWKDVLRELFPEFTAFFFPQSHAQIDWSRDLEFLDKELQQLAPEGDSGARAVDQLVKLWLHDGDTAWVLAHVEIQSQPGRDFPQRMYVYHYRIEDRYNRPVASWAVLGDDDPHYRPAEYSRSVLGCTSSLRFPTAKILDWAGREAELEASPNLFALAALTHLQAIQTRGDPDERYNWKLRLMRDLHARGVPRAKLIALRKFMSWVLDLPPELDRRLKEQFLADGGPAVPLLASWDVEKFEEGKQEGIQEGRQEGRQEGIQEGRAQMLIDMMGRKFGAPGRAVALQLQAASDASLLEQAAERFVAGVPLSEIEALLPAT